MPIVAAGIAGLGDLIGGGLGALFGGLDAAAGALGAGAAGAGAVGAADVAAGGAAAGEAGVAGTSALALGDVAAPVAEGAFAGIPGGIPLADVAPITDAGVGAIAPTSTSVLGGVDTSLTGTTVGDIGSLTASGAPSTGFTGLTAYAPAQADAAITTLPGAVDTGAAGTASTVGAIPGSITAAGAPTAGAAGGGGNILEALTGAVTAHPFQAASAALGAGGLIYNLMRGNAYPEAKTLQGLAGQEAGMLADFRAGKLPVGYQTAIKQATQAAKAGIISSYASRGQNTDPRFNTQLARDLAAADENALVMGAQIGEKLLSGGLQAVGLEAEIYQNLLNLDVKQTAATGQAIANFATALGGMGGGRGGVNINLPAGSTVSQAA